MAYNRINYLERVVVIQELVKKYQNTGSTLIWIYKNIVNPQFRISYSTYNNYLSIPAKKLLKEIKENMKTEMIELTEEQKQEIDSLTHEQMCFAWRFGDKKHPEWFNKTYAACDYFYNKLFVEYGGFTPEMSKQMGF